MIKAYNEDGELVYSDITDAVCSVLALKGEAVVDVSFASRDEIRQLNATSRNIDKATDVLSFPMLDSIMPFTEKNYPLDYDADEKAVLLGSIMICSDIASEQAKEYGHSVERENYYLFTHGLLHLLGYDHIEESDKTLMRQKEEEVLSSINISR